MNVKEEKVPNRMNIFTFAKAFLKPFATFYTSNLVHCVLRHLVPSGFLRKQFFASLLSGIVATCAAHRFSPAISIFCILCYAAGKTILIGSPIDFMLLNSIFNFTDCVVW